MKSWKFGPNCTKAFGEIDKGAWDRAFLGQELFVSMLITSITVSALVGRDKPGLSRNLIKSDPVSNT